MYNTTLTNRSLTESDFMSLADMKDFGTDCKVLRIKKYKGQMILLAYYVTELIYDCVNKSR